MENIDSLIRFWQSQLQGSQFLMSPSTVTLIEQTIKALEELKKMQEVNEDKFQHTLSDLPESK